MEEASSKPTQHIVVRKTWLIKYVREENWTTVMTTSFIHRVHALFSMVYIMEVRGVQIFQTPMGHLKIVGISRVTSISALRTDTFGTTIQKFRFPGVLTHEFVYLRCR